MYDIISTYNQSIQSKTTGILTYKLQLSFSMILIRFYICYYCYIHLNRFDVAIAFLDRTASSAICIYELCVILKLIVTN